MKKIGDNKKLIELKILPYKLTLSAKRAKLRSQIAFK